MAGWLAGWWELLPKRARARAVRSDRLKGHRRGRKAWGDSSSRSGRCLPSARRVSSRLTASQASTARQTAGETWRRRWRPRPRRTECAEREGEKRERRGSGAGRRQRQQGGIGFKGKGLGGGPVVKVEGVRRAAGLAGARNLQSRGRRACEERMSMK
ncbi:hypothetical protein BDY21DRAFT_164890 [Lineolata rhizophorae]|uniref:Uncharacterized protein n=1 Tax=Lineolata rhizophorae TaxID=578093 RepID=A0A6A6PAH8_9PEZI|nr:hypothetical protein BDY21DRAFT_164890 [Lineolata rhizophorae]